MVKGKSEVSEEAYIVQEVSSWFVHYCKKYHAANKEIAKEAKLAKIAQLQKELKELEEG